MAVVRHYRAGRRVMTRTACAGLATAALVAACRPPTPAAPLAAIEAQCTSPHEPVVGALPERIEAPDGADAAAVLIATSICAAAYLRADEGPPTIGCRSHPPFDRPEDRPDGTLPAYSGDRSAFCSIRAIHRGSFSRAGAPQAVVIFDSCEDHGAAWNGSMPGSAVLVESVGGRFRAIDYEGAIRECKTVRLSDGHDVMLCRGWFGWSGAGALTSFFLLDFAERSTRVRVVARLFEDLLQCSMLEPTFSLPHGLVDLAVKDRLDDVDGDGLPDLVLDVERTRVPPGPALDRRVRVACTAQAALPKGSQPTHTTLVFPNDGRGLSASPSARATLAKWESEAPPGFNGLADLR